jgi:hypothetical protein
VSYDAGSITATADLDRTPFTQGLDLARRDAQRFADSKYTAKADVDTREASAKVISLKDHLDRLGRDTATPRVDLGGVAVAEAQLAGLNQQMDRLSRRGGGVGGGGRGGILGALGGAASHAPSFMSLGMGAAIPAALPLAGLAAGAGAALLTPITTGLAGLVPFAAAASASLKTVEKDVTTLTTLQKQYNLATTDKQRAAVLAKEQYLWKSLDPAQRKAVKNVQGLDESWKRFQTRLQPQTFGALAAGVGIINTLLKDALPVSKAVGDEIINLEGQAGKAFKDPFWHNFFTKFLGQEAPRAIDTLGVSAGHFFTGLAHLTEDFAPLGHDFEAMLVRWSTRFEHWTEGQGPGKFVAWVEKNGPTAAHALGALAHGVEGIGKGLFPIGQVELKAFTPVLNFIGDLGEEHPAVITAIGTALLGVGAGLKVIAGVKGITTVLGGIRGLRGGGGIGGIGGAASKLDPVPVYVTNWGGGPLPGGGKEPVPVGGKTSWLRNLGKILPGPLVLSEAYLATQGGDQSPAQTPLVANAQRNGPLGNAITKLILDIDKMIPKSVNVDFFKGRLDAPGGRPLNAPVLANAVLDYGTPSQIQRLKELAKTYPEISKAIKEYNKQQSDLNKLLIVNPGLAKNSAAANKILEGALRNLGKGAGVAGKGIGSDLGRGLIVGLEAQIPHATVAGKLLVQAAAKSMRLAAQIGSPSKLTRQYGEWWGQGFAQGIASTTGLTARSIAGLNKAALNSLDKGLQQAISKDQQALQTTRSNAAQYRSGILSSLTGSAGLSGFQFIAPTGRQVVQTHAPDASGFGAKFTTVPGQPGSSGTDILNYLGHQRHLIHRFIRDIKALRQRGLDEANIMQVIGMGPQQGDEFAQAILGGPKGTIAGLNADQRSINRMSRQFAAQSTDAKFGDKLDQQIKELRGARAELREVVKELKTLNHKGPAAIGTATASALNDTARQAAHKAHAKGNR